MMRTQPDPVLAAAARAELERRVRAAAADVATDPIRSRAVAVPERRRAWLLQAVGGAAAVLLVAGLAVALQHAAPPDRATTVPAVSAPVATAPTSTSTSAPAPAPTPQPSGAAPSPVPSPAESGPLVGEAGAVRRSDAELRAFARASAAANVDPVVLGDQDVVIAHCMAGEGWLYDPVRMLQVGLTAHPGLTEAQWTGFQVALHGPVSSGPYDWRTAGCDGLAVHETGQDGKH